MRLGGQQVNVEVSAVPIKFRGLDETLVFAHDITNRKQADRERVFLTTRCRAICRVGNDY